MDWNVLLLTGVHAFGLCASALLTDVLQLAVGAPTPHFLSVCRPNRSVLAAACGPQAHPPSTAPLCTATDHAAVAAARFM